ncbi:MAG TPA: iron ABC transporter permease [Dehalococcoidia bacterium]|nr:iron ABC transporter permease [Dehalococcoidia bacterium]
MLNNFIKNSKRPQVKLLIPVMLIVAALLAPLIYLVVRSLSSGLNIMPLISNQYLWQSLRNTMYLIVTVSVCSLGLALPCAWIATRSNIPFRQVWAVLFALPLVIPTYVGGLIVVSFLGPRGLLQKWFEFLFEIERLPSIYGLSGATFTLTIFSYPYVYLSVRSGFLKLDRSLEEVAVSMGLNKLQTFMRVTLRQLWPAILSGVLLVSLYVLSDFGAVSLLKYRTFSWSIFIQYESVMDRNMAAVYSTILMVTALVLTLGEGFLQKKARYHLVGSTPNNPISANKEKVANLVSLTFSGLIVFLSMVGPIAILCYWVIRGWLRSEILYIPWERMFNSVYLSLIASVVIVIVALPLSMYVTQYRGLLSKIIRQIVPIGFGLPGIAVALALVFFAANWLPWIYQTLPVLIFAYVILFISPAFGILTNSLMHISPSLAEASKSLGRSSSYTFFKITMPLLIPGITSAMAMVFLLVMKELPATLILSPLGFSNLATSSWSYAIEAFFAKSSLYSLFIILISSVPLTYLMTKGYIAGDVEETNA